MKQNVISFALSLLVCTGLTACKKAPPAAEAEPVVKLTEITPPPPLPEPARRGRMIEVKWPPGQKLTYRMEVEQKMPLQMPGATEAMEQGVKMAQTYSLAVLKELPGGGRELEMEFLALEFEAAMGGQVIMEFDSKESTEADKENMLAPAFRQIIGAKVRLTLNERSEVTASEGAAGLLAGVAQNALGPLRSLMQGNLSEDDLRGLFEYYRVVPENPVEAGESWTQTLHFTAIPMGALAVEATTKFTGSEDQANRPCVRLDFAGPLPPGKSAQGGILGSTTLESGTLTGTAWFDPAAGILVAATNHHAWKGKMTLPRLLGGGTSVMDVTQSSALKLVETAALTNP